MNKNKIISLYNDFSTGKFLSAQDRLSFNDRFKKAENIINKYYADVNSNQISGKVHPNFINTLTVNVKDEILMKKPERTVLDAISALSQKLYINSYREYPAGKDNIFIVSDKILEYFSGVELPENLLFTEIEYSGQLPALFLFENNTVGYLDFFSHSEKDMHNLYFLFYGGIEKAKYIPVDLIVSSSTDNNKYPPVSEYLADQTGDILKKYRFILNILLFLNTKNVMKFRTNELNPVILEAEKNIKSGKNIGRNTRIINDSKSYKFIDLNLTLNEYSKNELKRNNSESSTKEPHWRSEHYHAYWTGPRDSEKRKRVYRFIPRLWVGDSHPDQDQVIFKKLK